MQSAWQPSPAAPAASRLWLLPCCLMSYLPGWLSTRWTAKSCRSSGDPKHQVGRKHNHASQWLQAGFKLDELDQLIAHHTPQMLLLQVGISRTHVYVEVSMRRLNAPHNPVWLQMYLADQLTDRLIQRLVACRHACMPTVSVTHTY